MNENLVIGVASKCSLNHALQVPAQPTTTSGATQPIIPLPPQWPRSGAVPLLPHAAPHVQTPPGPGATGGTCRGPGATGGTCRGPHAKTEDCVAQPGDCTVGLSMSTEAVGPVAILSPGLSIYGGSLGQPTRDRWGDMGCNCGDRRHFCSHEVWQTSLQLLNFLRICPLLHRTERRLRGSSPAWHTSQVLE